MRCGGQSGGTRERPLLQRGRVGIVGTVTAIENLPTEPRGEGEQMNTDTLVHLFVAAGCGIIFITTFLAGDIAGALIESRMKKRWSRFGKKMGLAFDGSKARCPSLSKLFLPKIVFPGTKESAFCYGETLKTLKGTVQGLDVVIADFSVWDLYVRGPLIFRMTVCIVSGDGVEFPAQASLVHLSSTMLHAFALSRDLRPYDFPTDRGFSRLFALLGWRESPPWMFNPDVRRFCVRHHRDVNIVLVRERSLVILWNDNEPSRLPSLLAFAVGLTTKLLDNVPAGVRLSRMT